MMRDYIFILKYIGSCFSLKRSMSSLVKDAAAWVRFLNCYRTYCRMCSREERPATEYLLPCLGEDTQDTPLEPIYFYQDAWCFEKIVMNQPAQHIDVGSHHKFVAHLSKVVNLTMVDIRPLSLPMSTINFQRGSILDLPFADRSVESLSSLCVVEHIGLGRYGDVLDLKGSEKAIGELIRVMKPGGNLYLSVPLDDINRVYFNAHRAFTEEYILSFFQDFQLVESRYIYEREFLEENKSGFGTGCFYFRRIR